MKVKYSYNTIGCRIGNDIYIHPKLYTEPELYQAIMLHEKEHTSGYSFRDFLIDLDNHHMEGLKWKYYKFMLKNPRTILGLLPITKIGKHWVFDATMAAFVLAGGLMIYFLMRLWR